MRPDKPARTVERAEIISLFHQGEHVLAIAQHLGLHPQAGMLYYAEIDA